MRAHRLEEFDERGRGHQGRDRPDVAQPRCTQLQQRIATTRIAQVDAGDGEVERNLLVGFEVKVGQVERLAVNPVPVLLVAGQALREHGDALVTQQPLVPLEGLAASGVLRGVARHLVRDGVEGEGLARVEQHEHQIGDALEPIELAGASIAQSLRRTPTGDGRNPPLRLASPSVLAPRPARARGDLPVGDGPAGSGRLDRANGSSSSAGSPCSRSP